MAILKNSSIVLIAIAFLFVGCSSSKAFLDPTDKLPLNEPTYSLVYVIHGDANYLYHQNGKSYQADYQALKSALNIAEHATSGEVFIFYQKPEQKILWLFPKKDRIYYHFKNGNLVQKKTYSPQGGGLEQEAEIFNTMKASTQNRSFFFYFGHEIPSFKNASYHNSQPNKPFNSVIFSKDLSAFNKKFDLTVLSTCNNGNPQMIYELAGKTDAVIASPQNLHLSYLDTENVLLLEKDLKTPTLTLADSIANFSFTRLSSTLQTAVTVSVYDLTTIEPNLDDIYERYQSHLDSTKNRAPFTDNVDCKTLASLNRLIDRTGVHTYFKAANFGRSSKQSTHSGWGCKE